MTISIRPFDSADLDQVLQLERDVFGRDAWADDVFIAELAHPRSYYLVAEDHSVIVGFGGLRTPDRRGGQADIQTLAVLPGYRSQGWGRALVDALMTEAARVGAAELFLEVRADNHRARSLYESMGFAEISSRPGYYQPDGVDAVVMSRTVGG